jgi:cyclic-di-AMP phosphodiesterase PgpH
MNFFTYYLYNNIPNWKKYLVVLAAFVLLSFLFPSYIQFQYKYQIGQSWSYDDLFAEYDFAIKKADSEIEQEKSALLREINPYYEYDAELVNIKKKEFKKLFAKQLDQSRGANQFREVVIHPNNYLELGNKILDIIYFKGILIKDKFLKSKDNTFVINILKEDEIQKVTIENVFTNDGAIAYVNTELLGSKLKESEFLLPLIDQLIQPNLTFNKVLTNKYQENLLNEMNTSRGMVKAGDLIVTKGAIINNTVYQKLVSYEKKFDQEYVSSGKNYKILLGYMLMVMLILILFTYHLKYHHKPVFYKIKSLIFIYFWIIAYNILLYFVLYVGNLNIYFIPFCIAPILIKSFFSKELALFTHLVTLLLAMIIINPGIEFIILQLVTGLVIVVLKTETRYWFDFFKAIFYVTLVYCIGYLAISLYSSGNFWAVKWKIFNWIFLNGFLTMASYPMIPLFGRFFGFSSSISLAEMTDLNHPLLKKLSTSAPGTFQHSLQVSNIAEAAAIKINANSLLIKVGALYHDIGKIQNPEIFIENQINVIPSVMMSNIENAKLIIQHVAIGEKMAIDYRLPEELIRFISSHHGTTQVGYFYRTELMANNKANKMDFQYPGPKPVTKEETILMFADSLEASSKSLRNPTYQSIKLLVDRIVEDKLEQEQLSESELTYAELELCKTSFVHSLHSIYHMRIEYPE